MNNVTLLEHILQHQKKHSLNGFRSIHHALDMNLQDKTSQVSMRWIWQDVLDLILQTDDGSIAFFFSVERMPISVQLRFISLLKIDQLPSLRNEAIFICYGRVLRVRRPLHSPSLKCNGGDSCTNEALKACSLCRKKRYCSWRCQMKDWPKHYITCEKGWSSHLSIIEDDLSDSTKCLNSLRLDSQCIAMDQSNQTERTARSLGSHLPRSRGP